MSGAGYDTDWLQVYHAATPDRLLGSRGSADGGPLAAEPEPEAPPPQGGERFVDAVAALRSDPYFQASPGLSMLSLAVTGCHSVGIYAVILL